MKIWTIIKKEYRDIVKKKSFIISTILTPIMMAGFIFLPMLITKVGRNEKIIEIEDYSGIIQTPFQEKSESSKEANTVLKLKFRKTENQNQEQKEILQNYHKNTKDKKAAEFQLVKPYRDRILDKEVDGLILIPENVKESRKIFFCSTNISDFGTNKYITSTVQKIISEKILTEQNIELKIVEEAIRDVVLDTFKVKKEGTTKTSSGMEYMMSVIMLTILFSIIMAYGQLIMRGVIEEKNNRIIEVLISSTRAQTLFYGKIIGIGLAGLTQVALWILLGVIFLGRATLGINPEVINFLTPQLAIYFVIFFVIGYFMFSIMFSIVGASVNTDQEAQQFAAPISYLLLIPFILGIMVTQNPNTLLVTIASLIPIFTPTLMFMRICVAVPATAQIVLSIILSVLSTILLAWLGAKIFRVGILMYGKKPSIKEIIRWVRYR